MKPKRKKVQREWLENTLAKYERRIQRLAEQAYRIRQFIETLDRHEAEKAIKQEETRDAVHTLGVEAATSARTTDSNTREPQLLSDGIIETVLGQQQTELSSD